MSQIAVLCVLPTSRTRTNHLSQIRCRMVSDASFVYKAIIDCVPIYLSPGLFVYTSAKMRRIVVDDAAALMRSLISPRDRDHAV